MKLIPLNRPTRSGTASRSAIPSRPGCWLLAFSLLFLAAGSTTFAVNEVGDPNCSVVDVMQANRLVDVDPGDRFWLTVPVASGLAGVEVHREGDRGWTWLKAGEFLPVQYDQPGEYTIRFRTARALVLAPLTVRVFAPPAEFAEPPALHGQAGAGGVQVMAASGAPRFSLGSVYAGLYDEGATNKFPLRIVSYGAGDCVVIKAGGGWTNIYTFAAAGEQSDLVDVPAGQTWTLIKVGYGTHTLSTNTPGRLKVMDLILTNDLGHAPAPGSVTNLLWHALTNETVALRVMPGPYWVTNKPAAAASLFDWTTNNVALPVTTNLTQTFSLAVGTNMVNVACHSPAPATPTNQVTTVVGVVVETQTIATNPVNRARTTVGVGEEVELRVVPSLTNAVIWTVTAGGTITTNAGLTTTFTAPPTYTANSTATATIEGLGVINTAFLVLEPVGYTAASIQATNSYPINQASAGMELDVWIAPLTVSFYRVQMGEVPGPATDIWGYFTQFSSNALAHTTAGHFWRLNQENAWSDSTTLENWPAPWTNGGFRWEISARWFVPGGPTNSMTGWGQTFTIDTNGTVTINKFGCSVTRTTNNVITTTQP